MKKLFLATGFILAMIVTSSSTTMAMSKLNKKAVVKEQAPIEGRVEKKEALPKLVELGAHKCIPCKMMAPILEELKVDYKDKMDVVFIDVWQQPDEGQKYGIRMIPTQIFCAPDGQELFRHQGFFSKEDIMATWKKCGYDFRD